MCYFLKNTAIPWEYYLQYPGSTTNNIVGVLLTISWEYYLQYLVFLCFPSLVPLYNWYNLFTIKKDFVVKYFKSRMPKTVQTLSMRLVSYLYSITLNQSNLNIFDIKIILKSRKNYKLSIK